MGRVVRFEFFYQFLCLLAIYKGQLPLPTGDGGRWTNHAISGDSIMVNSINLHNKKHEAEEEQLFQLIKQAGEDARSRKREAMARHINKLQAVISEAVSRKNNSVST